MTLPRVFILMTLVLLALIGYGVWSKKGKESASTKKKVSSLHSDHSFQGTPIEIDLKNLQPLVQQTAYPVEKAKDIAVQPAQTKPVASKLANIAVSNEALPEADLITELFKPGSTLPFVETIKYKSRVSWKPGRAAWLIDYAFHYKTSLDFIARSINGAPNYTIPAIADGIEFNVLKLGNNFHFYLIADLSRHKMWFYYVDPSKESCMLLKTYKVCFGRISEDKKSGCLTPTGKYKLGSRVAVFKPKMMGMHKNKRVELVRVFGTRWIPFEKEIEGCSEPAKGFGIHGTPWEEDPTTHVLASTNASIGKYESDGCIRLVQKDIEELYSIISTRDTFIEIVPDYSLTKLPYQEF